MTASASPGGDIRVTPSALGQAAVVVRDLADGVRLSWPGSVAGSMLGDPVCADGLTSAARLVEQAVRASAEGIDQLAAALEGARGTYRLADNSAVPSRAGGRR